MATKGNDPLREELRSSQVYHVLKGSNIPVAGKIAQGLDRAAQGLDQVVEGFSTGTRPSGGNRGGHPYQAPPPAWQAPSQTPPQQRTAPQNTGYRPPQTGPSNVGKPAAVTITVTLRGDSPNRDNGRSRRRDLSSPSRLPEQDRQGGPFLLRGGRLGLPKRRSISLPAEMQASRLFPTSLRCL